MSPRSITWSRSTNKDFSRNFPYRNIETPPDRIRWGSFVGEAGGPQYCSLPVSREGVRSFGYTGRLPCPVLQESQQIRQTFGGELVRIAVAGSFAQRGVFPDSQRVVGREQKNILFGLTGTGYFDLTAYMSYRDGSMQDRELTDEELEAGFAGIPSLPGIQ